jgi:hypothetical protein
MNKQIYIAPTAETLEVKVEGVICGSPTPGKAGGNDSYHDWPDF